MSKRIEGIEGAMKKSGPLVLTFVVGLLVGSALHSWFPVRSRGLGNGQSVTGVGGVFFKAQDPAKLRAWYRDHLGLDGGDGPGVNFFWRELEDPSQFGLTVWSVFPRDTAYFGDAEQSFMVNYRVRDLDALLAKLRDQGVDQVGEIEDYWYGRFAWIRDGEGNRIELWQPVDYAPEEFDRRSRSEKGR
jgi:catechol 2,3-dioxygenase-like lactoylglutathione lyase family enzyme